MWALSMTWYLCAAAACNVIFNPEWVSSTSISKFQLSCLWSEFFLHVMGFPPLCSLSRSNHPAHMLSGLTEQLLALSNQVKWPCLYADLQLDTAVYSQLVHFADTILQANASKRQSISITARPQLVIFMSATRLRHPSFTDRWLMLLDQGEGKYSNFKIRHWLKSWHTQKPVILWQFKKCTSTTKDAPLSILPTFTDYRYSRYWADNNNQWICCTHFIIKTLNVHEVGHSFPCDYKIRTEAQLNDMTFCFCEAALTVPICSCLLSNIQST